MSEGVPPEAVQMFVGGQLSANMTKLIRAVKLESIRQACLADTHYKKTLEFLECICHDSPKEWLDELNECGAVLVPGNAILLDSSINRSFVRRHFIYPTLWDNLFWAYLLCIWVLFLICFHLFMGVPHRCPTGQLLSAIFAPL